MTDIDDYKSWIKDYMNRIRKDRKFLEKYRGLPDDTTLRDAAEKAYNKSDEMRVGND